MCTHTYLPAGHPWIRNYNNIKVPLDILIFKLMKPYMRSSPLRKAALRVCIRLCCDNYFTFLVLNVCVHIHIICLFNLLFLLSFFLKVDFLGLVCAKLRVSSSTETKSGRVVSNSYFFDKKENLFKVF